MKLRKRYSKNLGLFLISNCLTACLGILVLASSANSEPVAGAIALPPASFTYIDDLETLESIGLDGYGGAWCYDNQANAILITATARERAQCELKMKYELEKIKFKYKFEVDKLNLRIQTLSEQHEKVLSIKEEEINKLTEAALKRPNDYTAWWASGGVLVGAVATLLISMAL